MAIVEEIEEFIRVEISLEEVGRDQDLLETDLLDSAGMMVLVAFLEKRFCIEIDDDLDLVPANFRTIAAMTEFVKRKLAASAE